MNRRGFLKLFTTAAPIYFLAPIGGWKSDIIMPAAPAIPEEAWRFLRFMDEASRRLSGVTPFSGGNELRVPFQYGGRV